MITGKTSSPIVLIRTDWHVRETSPRYPQKKKLTHLSLENWPDNTVRTSGQDKTIPQEIQDGLCCDAHLYVQLKRGPCSSETVQSLVLHVVRVHHREIFEQQTARIKHSRLVQRMYIRVTLFQKYRDQK